MRFASLAVVLTLTAATTSVWTGVYTKEQAARGEKAYNAQCARCHSETLLGGENSPPLVEKEFLEKWYGNSVGALVERTRKTMPSDGPGKLSRRTCTDIVAYMLKSNGFPAGDKELDSDPAIANEIIIQPKQ